MSENLVVSQKCFRLSGFDSRIILHILGGKMIDLQLALEFFFAILICNTICGVATNIDFKSIKLTFLNSELSQTRHS